MNLTTQNHPEDTDREFLAEIYPLLQEKRLKEDLIRAAGFVEGKKERFQILLDEIETLQQPLRDRMVWVTQLAAERWPELLSKEIMADMAETFRTSTSDADIRAMLNVFRNHDLPDEYLAEVFERCQEFVHNPKKAIAIRVYGLYVMARIAEKHPGLKNETLLSMDSMNQDMTPAMFVAIRKVRKQLTNTSRKS